MGNNEKKVLHTLLYSDIFHFPLTQEETYRYLIASERTSRKECKAALRNLMSLIEYRKGLYCLRGNSHIIEERLRNKKLVTEKIRIARKVAKLLSYIPTVQVIGISGGLAVKSAKKYDDIDLFLITKKGSLFITRLLALVLLEMTGLRRRRGMLNVANKICLNMIIDETCADFAPNRRDLYTAHEIAQLLPLVERGEKYKEFFLSNSWIRKFLPNSSEKQVLIVKEERLLQRVVATVVTLLPFEILAKTIQRILINRHLTHEEISDNFVAFHPRDYRIQILGEYSKKLKYFSKLYTIQL